jgi:DNA-binding FadR family transcriptional regulator
MGGPASVESDETFRVPNAAELVAAHLRRQIVRGELAEGSSLPPESKLLAAFGVSGPTLRAAYRVLEAEGLITVRRGSRGGATVHRPGLDAASRYVGLVLQMEGASLDDLFAARVILEPPLAGLAALHARKGGIADLTRLADEEEAVLDDGPAFAAASSRFHQRLIELSGNRSLALLCGLVWHLIERQTTTAVQAKAEPGDLRARSRALRAHRRLVELIAAADPAGAESFWAGHMRAVGQLFSQAQEGRALVELFN